MYSAGEWNDNFNGSGFLWRFILCCYCCAQFGVCSLVNPLPIYVILRQYCIFNWAVRFGHFNFYFKLFGLYFDSFISLLDGSHAIFSISYGECPIYSARRIHSPLSQHNRYFAQEFRGCFPLKKLKLHVLLIKSYVKICSCTILWGRTSRRPMLKDECPRSFEMNGLISLSWS